MLTIAGGIILAVIILKLIQLVFNLILAWLIYEKPRQDKIARHREKIGLEKPREPIFSKNDLIFFGGLGAFWLVAKLAPKSFWDTPIGISLGWALLILLFIFIVKFGKKLKISPTPPTPSTSRGMKIFYLVILPILVAILLIYLVYNPAK